MAKREARKLSDASGVAHEVRENAVLLRLDVTPGFNIGVSSTGKTLLLANTHGPAQLTLPDGRTIAVNMSAWLVPDAAAVEAAQKAADKARAEALRAAYGIGS